MNSQTPESERRRRNRNPGFTEPASAARGRGKVRLKLTPFGLFAAIVVVAGLALLFTRVLPGVLANRSAAAAAFPAGPILPPVLPGSTGLPALPPASGAVVINETFDTLGNWKFATSSGPDFRIALENGEYHAEVTNTALHNYYEQGMFDNGSVEVDARWVEGDDLKNARVGLVLRRSDLGAYYFEYYPFQNGFWVFQAGDRRTGKDVFQTLGQGSAPGLALRDPKAWQRLRVDMSGAKMRLFVNGQYLSEVDTPQFQKGALGLVVTATDGKRTHMAFDNFTVRNLK